MNKENLPKIELKADLTKVAEQAYQDTLSKPLESSSGVIETVIDFFHNTILYPMQKYNLYAEEKLRNYALELEIKAQSIPKEYLSAPRVNILGPVFEGLKYNLDEDYIKKIFTNILLSDMDTRKKDKVLPAYISIVNQLSEEDAQTLNLFQEHNVSEEPIIKLKIDSDIGGYREISNDMILVLNDNYKILDSIILDNLQRIKLIEITFMESLTNKDIYESTFKKFKIQEDLTELPCDINKLSYLSGLMKITDFGQNFIDICLS